MSAIIYLLTNIINNKKKYVGMTSRTPHRRWKQHCLLANYNSEFHIVAPAITISI